MNYMSLNAFINGGAAGVDAMRPFLNEKNEPRIKINEKQTMVANDATLRYDEWKDIDRTVLEVQVDRLVAVADLIGGGLTHDLGSLGAIISQWQKSSDMTEAEFSMSGITPGEKDRVVFSTDSVPVPIVHKDFSVNIRHLMASRRQGQGIDVIQASIASRKVAEASEDMLFSGEPITVEGGTIYGYLNYPDRATVDHAVPWDTIAQADNADIIAEVQTGLAALRAAKHYGPYTMYIPSAYEGKLDEDYRELDTRTVRDRIMALSGMKSIKVADRMPANHVVIVQLTRDVVDMAIAQQTSTVQWQSHGPMVTEFKVMACWVPRLKSDFEGNVGICELRPGT
jgi:uncharacterized linocin/CFP29 family protein